MNLQLSSSAASHHPLLNSTLQSDDPPSPFSSNQIQSVPRSSAYDSLFHSSLFLFLYKSQSGQHPAPVEQRAMLPAAFPTEPMATPCWSSALLQVKDDLHPAWPGIYSDRCGLRHIYKTSFATLPAGNYSRDHWKTHTDSKARPSSLQANSLSWHSS